MEGRHGPQGRRHCREQADAIAEHAYDQFAARRRVQLENEAEADGLKQLEDEVKKLPARKKPGSR